MVKLSDHMHSLMRHSKIMLLQLCRMHLFKSYECTLNSNVNCTKHFKDVIHELKIHSLSPVKR